MKVLKINDPLNFIGRRKTNHSDFIFKNKATAVWFLVASWSIVLNKLLPIFSKKGL